MILTYIHQIMRFLYKIYYLYYSQNNTFDLMNFSIHIILNHAIHLQLELHQILPEDSNMNICGIIFFILAIIFL